MAFIEPALLWGALALGIPILIHFWHQKQGKPLPWAATQWLVEKQQQQSRGFRLDNVWLLIIRCLLLILLVVLLAQPLVNWLRPTPTIQKIHLVQPSSVVADNFRFELTEALKQGEKAFWIDNPLEPLTDKLTPTPAPATFNPLVLQTAIHQIDSKNTELHLYVSPDQALANVPAITVPTRFKLHTVTDSVSRPVRYLSGTNNRKLFINRAGKLTSSPTLEPSLKFGSAPAHSGPIRTLLAYRNDRERQTVKAALAALTDIYGLDMALDEGRKPNQAYDWVLTDQLPAKATPHTFYVISGMVGQSTYPNVVFTPEPLTPQTSERVETGELPEWLGEQVVQYYGLTTNNQSLNRQELTALFIPTKKPASGQQAGLQNGLFIGFIGLLIVERWLALTKNA